ncbi:unnamed protein product, partial [Larinioides sclopetarius]
GFYISILRCQLCGKFIYRKLYVVHKSEASSLNGKV